jgi:hypothetical protein
MGGDSYVLFDGKLMRLDGGIDAYLQVFAKYYHNKTMQPEKNSKTS